MVLGWVSVRFAKRRAAGPARDCVFLLKGFRGVPTRAADASSRMVIKFTEDGLTAAECEELHPEALEYMKSSFNASSLMPCLPVTWVPVDDIIPFHDAEVADLMF